MNYENFVGFINNEIEKAAAENDKKRLDMFRHHKTALNNVVSNFKLVEPENFAITFFERFDDLLEKYKSELKYRGRSDTRGPLTKLRRVREMYVEMNNIDFKQSTFSEILLEAAKRKFGEKLYLDSINPKNQKEVKDKHITLREIATDIVIKAVKANPKLFESVKTPISSFKATEGLSSASKLIRDYLTGEVVPSERVPDERLEFIEDYFLLPRGILLDKVLRKRRSAVKKQSRKSKQKKVPGNPVRKKRLTELCPGLLRVYNEYTDFKLHGTHPPIVNIPKESTHDRRWTLRNSLNEESQRKNRNWSIDATDSCGSAKSFYSQLLGFQEFCLEDAKLPIDQISSAHLTDPELLYDFASWSKVKGNGGSSTMRLLNFVFRASQKRGYLRLCGERGDRDVEEYFDDLDFIQEQYYELISKLEGTVRERGKAADKGKENIKFLQNYKATNRRHLVHRASVHLVSESSNFLREAKRQLRKAAKAETEILRFKAKKSASHFAQKAFDRILTAVILETSFVVAPRASTWCDFKYYESVHARDERYCSITYLRQKNRFEMMAPLYGPSLVNDQEWVRYLKNSDAKNATPIHIILPEYLTPLFKKYIDIRSFYIEHNMTFNVKEDIADVEAEISKLSSTETSMPSSKVLALIEEYEKDLVSFKAFNPKDIELFIPWRSVRTSETRESNSLTNPIWKLRRLLRRNFIQDPSKLGMKFKDQTCDAFYNISPEDDQNGINIHAMRHLAAETYLENNPGDYLGAAALLNDEVETVIKVYGNRDRAKAMRELAEQKPGFEVAY